MRYSVEQNATGPKLVLEDRWTPEIGQLMLERNIKALELNVAKGWHETEISFLGQIPSLEHLDLFTWLLADVSPISSMTNLRYLHIGMPWKTPIDLSRLQSLECCLLDSGPGSNTALECPRLRTLATTGYKSMSPKDMAKLVNLHTLRISQSPIKALPTLPCPDKLRELSVLVCPNLEVLDDVRDFINLETLQIRACKRFHTIAPFSELSRLRHLELSDNGDIDTLLPLRDHPSLEYVRFFGATRIVDGNLEPLNHLPSLKEASFENRRHYSHKSDDFPKMTHEERRTYVRKGAS